MRREICYVVFTFYLCWSKTNFDTYIDIAGYYFFDCVIILLVCKPVTLLAAVEV